MQRLAFDREYCLVCFCSFIGKGAPAIRKSIWIVVVIFLVCISSALYSFVRIAQQEATRMRVFGRLSQLRLSLANYESVNGILPRRELIDSDGKACLSWVAAVLPHLEHLEVFEKLNLEKRWDSPENADAVRGGNRFWEWILSEDYLPCPLRSDQSIWDVTTGLPRGSLTDFPDAIALIALPVENKVSALEPIATSEHEIVSLLKGGKRVFFIDCDGKYGSAVLERDSVSFLRSKR